LNGQTDCTVQSYKYFLGGLSDFNGVLGQTGWVYRKLTGEPVSFSATIDATNSPFDTGGSALTGSTGPIKLNADDLLNGLELLCEIEQDDVSQISLTSPPRVDSIADLDRAGSYIRELGKEVRNRGALAVFAHVPMVAANALTQESGIGAYP